MSKKDCVEVFNNIIKNKPVNDKVFNLISEYLVDTNHSEHINEMLTFLQQNFSLVGQIFPQIIEHFCLKYNIVKILDKNNQIIMYYE